MMLQWVRDAGVKSYPQMYWLEDKETLVASPNRNAKQEPMGDLSPM